MTTRKRVNSWVVTDDFWARVEPLIPVRQRLDSKEYLRKPGAGRPPKPARQVFEAVMYVLRTGCQWKAFPKERFGSASAVHKRFLEWEAAGAQDAPTFDVRSHHDTLAQTKKRSRIDWSHQ